MPDMSDTMKIGVIGYGYWGPNVVRCFNLLENADVVAVCDGDPKARKRFRHDYHNIDVVADSNKVLSSPEIDAVAIVTPVNTHYQLARKALLNGKHVFVEKPFTCSVSEAEKLIELAEKKNLRIMVDHTFLFTGAVRKIKELIDDNVLGELYYYDSLRINLGLFQHDVNVVWDLAPHDFSIMDYIIGEVPVGVSATGADHFGTGMESVAYISVFFGNNLIAHFNVNWLSPVKLRTTRIGGSKKMLVWNDLVTDEKIKVYDKGVKVRTREGIYKLLIDYRSGDMWAPKVEMKEALKAEAAYFIECITNNKSPVNDGYAGLRVVKLIEASNKSLKRNGREIRI
jgi:predicted dehydrogenase